MSEKIAVLGAGSWGSILARNLLDENGNEVSLWSYNLIRLKNSMKSTLTRII